jgi:hypothetical protein
MSDEQFYEKARLDAVQLLGFADLERLTPSQSAKVDLVLSLRLAIDSLQSQLLAGEPADLSRLVSATEMLCRQLPTAAPGITPDAPRVEDSARAKMERLLDGIERANVFEEMRVSAIQQIELTGFAVRMSSCAPSCRHRLILLKRIPPTVAKEPSLRRRRKAGNGWLDRHGSDRTGLPLVFVFGLLPRSE